jgi:predicted transcriptional regulator
MEAQFEPAVQAKLDRIARESGRAAAELVQDAVAGYVDELSGTRDMLDARYDDIKSGKVKLIDGEEAFARLHERIEARRNDPGTLFTRKP